MASALGLTTSYVLGPTAGCVCRYASVLTRTAEVSEELEVARASLEAATPPEKVCRRGQWPRHAS
jgi:hypothetical protein